MSANKVTMTFRIFRGNELVKTETLTQETVKIGSLPSSHLRLEDENVSRMHALIEHAPSGELYIMDLGSKAGTIVNGKKVNKATLQPDDQIELGGLRIEVAVSSAGAKLASPTVDEDDEVTSMASASEVQAAVRAAAPEIQRPPLSSPPLANPFAAPAGGLPNPFAAPAPEPAWGGGGHGGHGHGEEENPDHFRYGIAASGPPVNPSDVETAASAVEVTLMWGDVSVLTVAHLSPPRAFYVGEKTGTQEPDYLMGSEALGTDRMPLVVESGGGSAVVVPQGAEGTVTDANGQSYSWDELRAQGRLQPCSEFASAMQFPLMQGTTASVKYRGFQWVVKATSAGRPIGVGGGPQIQWQNYTWTLVSLGIHAAFLLMFYFLPPRPASLSLDLLDANSRLVQYLMEPPETVEEEETPEFMQESTDTEGGTGKRHKDEEGAMGEESSQKTTNRYGIEGPQDNPDPHMARQQARENAATAGAIGVLAAMTGAWNSPTSPYGQDTALGADPMSALGALQGDQIGSNFGFGGLGLRGTGRGGGGTGEGTIGLGNLGTIGHGSGTGSGNGYGSGAGSLSGRSARVPVIRTPEAEVRGSLSREVIRRVVRRHINEVRFCYEQELNSRPDLAGRVTVSFIISGTGAVQTATVANTTLNNPRVEGCIATAVRRWTFPSPDGGGVVGVNYPFVLDATGG